MQRLSCRKQMLHKTISIETSHPAAKVFFNQLNLEFRNLEKGIASKPFQKAWGLHGKHSQLLIVMCTLTVYWE